MFHLQELISAEDCAGMLSRMGLKGERRAFLTYTLRANMLAILLFALPCSLEMVLRQSRIQGNVVFAQELGRRYSDSIVSTSLHPGT
jgi:hypothetical protein